MEGTIKAAPEELLAKSGQFSAKASQVKALHDEMIGKVNGLSGLWTGAASDTYRSQFAELQKSMDEIHRRIMDHARELKEMAGIYEES